MMGPAMNSFLEGCAHLPEFKQASSFTPGRCVPALSFVFNMARSPPPLALTCARADDATLYACVQNVVPPFLREEAQRDRESAQDSNQRPVAEKLRYSLEAQVRYIIRRSRVLPSSENRFDPTSRVDCGVVCVPPQRLRAALI
jgi:hypothetical protein